MYAALILQNIFYLYKFFSSLFICVTEADVFLVEFENKVFASIAVPPDFIQNLPNYYRKPLITNGRISILKCSA